jgi:ATP-dependent Clp protease ATP-binding subunit ClpX
VAQWYTPPALEAIPTVTQIVERASTTVAGLTAEMTRLATLLRRHMVAAALGRSWRVPNALLIGPSGGGKTHMMRALLAACPVPWIEANATEYSDVGYFGADLTSMYAGLLAPPWFPTRYDKDGDMMPPRDADLAVVQRWGVVIIDEWDKLRAQVSRVGERVVGKALQAELLKLTEGADVGVKRYNDDIGFSLRTHRLLHIGMGAFQGLDMTVRSRRGETYDPDVVNTDDYLRATPDDLAEYGFLDELVGRFSSVVTLPPLTADQLHRVLVEQVWPAYVEQTQDAFGVDLVGDEPALRVLATMATKLHVGARALPSMLDQTLWRAWAQAQRGDRISLDVQAVQQANAHLEHDIFAEAV